TEISFTNKNDTREIVDEVVENAFSSVCSTMGPNGNYVVINQLNSPKVTKDGVSVARALDFNEARRNMIAKIITEPSIKTDAEVGDGTTTTVFITYHLYQKFKDAMSFANTRYLDTLIKQVLQYIGTLIQPGEIESEMFRNMLLTSSNYEEEIVDKILDIYREHKNPNIHLEKSPMLPADEVKMTKEIYFEGSFPIETQVPANGAYVVGPEKVGVVLIDGSIRAYPTQLINALLNRFIDNPVVLMARNFEPEVIAAINNENQRLGTSRIFAYKVNAAGLLGAGTIDDLGRLLNIGPVFDVNSVDPALVKYNDVTLWLGRKGILLDKSIEEVESRADSILEGLDNRYEALGIIERQTPIGRELNRRIGRLRANNVTIKVTGVTVSDASERWARYEDVMKAARTGQQFGVIPGIGYGYLMASKWLEANVPQQSDEKLEKCRIGLIEVLRAQYEHLTGHDGSAENPIFIDLVTGQESDTPMNVYDNAAATMIALEGAWQTAKTLGKISNVMGRSNTNYA
nr:Chain A, Putative chaperonin GroEL [Pseudomonas phage OBP]6HDD_B Chain B, Putative chaperonin GroEL [Pseudomonas phage OBP]6HDD_C Chain C, Putative chaperonin GroEL [Pseudomonas phage OBP]6HDD_D Chain D, Putative chaperonin GroEL [Pseudomonas phage OBP]6HDD_E Chain E, Putative chaperonin GroEL [Pseudomonas phage OBP]6HDD_F Chain F, Putative chaperonin GroEL [Pseudomonas phage OBP]6HDD_G Chain G, Putative chaperonin GroEL [Pseudomonas phage OBP]